MSRPMRQREIEAFEREHGYKPTELRIAIDAVGVFVHRDNPITGLNFEQLDSIFSSTLRCGSTQSASTWADLGLDYQWAKRSMQLFGRNSVSGTYGYFKKWPYVAVILEIMSMNNQDLLRLCKRPLPPSILSVIRESVIKYLEPSLFLSRDKAKIIFIPVIAI